MRKYTVQVDGMQCGMCESHINQAVRNTFPVKKVTSSHSRGETVILIEGEIDEEKLQAAISSTGYRVLSISHEECEKQGLFSFLKK